jgi:hypothetical protein
MPDRAAGDNFNRFVDKPHDFRGLLREPAVFERVFAADLPWAVNFVAEAPRLDFVRRFIAVLRAQIA